MTIRKTLSAVLAGSAMLAALPASAADVFVDDFEGYGSQAVPWNGGGVWSVVEGSVDLVDTPNYGITCAGGDGFCVDLIGTAPGGEVTGEIMNTAAFFLAAGSYTFSFDYSGNQRGAAASSFSAFISDGGANTPFSVTLGPLASNAPWTTYSGTFSVLTAGNYNISFDQQAGPGNIGNLIDNVALRSAVPEPATWAMMILGFGLVGGAMRRRRSALSYA